METFLRYWPFVQGIHRSPVNSPHKGQWRGVLIFSLICAWINGCVNNHEAGDLRRHRVHYDVTVISLSPRGAILRQAVSCGFKATRPGETTHTGIDADDTVTVMINLLINSSWLGTILPDHATVLSFILWKEIGPLTECRNDPIGTETPCRYQ